MIEAACQKRQRVEWVERDMRDAEVVCCRCPVPSLLLNVLAEALGEGGVPREVLYGPPDHVRRRQLWSRFDCKGDLGHSRLPHPVESKACVNGTPFVEPLIAGVQLSAKF